MALIFENRNGNRRMISRSSTPEEIEHMKKVNFFAEAVVEHMKANDLTPDDWEELEHLIAQKISRSTKNVWA